MKNKKQTIIGLIILVVAILIALIIFFGNPLNSKVVAIVNGDKISRQEFEITKDQLSQMQGVEIEDGQVIDQMIINILLAQQAKKEGFEVTDEELQTQYQALLAQAGGKEVFLEGLEELGIPESYVKNDIKKQILIEKYISKQEEENDFLITDEEVSNFYDQLSSQQGEVPAFGEIEEQIRIQLIQQKLNEFILGTVSELREKSEINIKI
jgi:cell division protein YceG involved in septum cleavage